MPDPQIWYAGSAVDQLVHEYGIVLARIRERGMAGSDPSLAYFEWSIPQPVDDGRKFTPDDVSEEVAGDLEMWALANPGLGIRIAADHVASERRSMGPRQFAVERLGVGDWPATEPGGAAIIDLGRWGALADAASVVVGQPCLAFDVAPDRSSAAIARAGRNADGLPFVDVFEHRRGTGWVVERLAQEYHAVGPQMVVCSGTGITGTLVDELALRGVLVTAVNATEYAQACAGLVDLVLEDGVRHLGSKELRDAIRGAATRPLGDAWAWSRKSSSVDISPLVAATLAVWGTVTSSSGEYVYDVRALIA
jgi:hypothetical protein